MNPDQRAAVRDNARYLRSVRPVDPEEIYEYVDGQPHPAVVRQVLREEAFDLGMVERDDGTFVPVDDGTVAVDFDGVAALPAEYGECVDDLLTERYGTDWERGESGEALRETVRRLKADYFERQGADVDYDADTALAYALYHLPGTYAAAAYAFAELARDDLLPRRLRVLDVGAGVGGPALAALDLLPDDCLLEYHAVEPSAAADVFEELVSPGRNRSVELHRETAEAFAPDGEYDLVVFANVLSELDDPAGVARRYLDALREDGTGLLLAPADRNTAIGLREVERALCDGAPSEPSNASDGAFTPYAPTVRLWPGYAPTDRGWSFTRKPDLAVPDFQRRLDEAGGATGEFVNVDVQYAYSVLRRDGRCRVEFTADASRYARMADSEEHVTDRVDVVAAKLSHDLGERNPLFKVSDGSEAVDHYAVLTEETALNRDLRSADYGSLLAFENVLVLWNADEKSYNLVVGEDCVVDRVGP